MFIVDFVLSNYVWFIIAIIVILLAVIGSYAEKTNFGLGKKIEETDKKDFDINAIADKKLGDFVAVPNQPEKSKADANVIEQPGNVVVQNNVAVQKTINKPMNQNINTKKVLNKQIEAIIPKKNIVDSSLLADIDDISLKDLDIGESSLFKREKEKLLFSDKIKSDDLKLPEIKSLKEKKEKDIWKF